MKINDVPQNLFADFQRGMVIPAMPLALDSRRRLDPIRQKALIRYYHASGAGGLAVGVHTTQFEIRQPKYNLFLPILQLASETLDEAAVKNKRSMLKIAGLCGKTDQAIKEASLALSCGYHAGLLSLAALSQASVQELLAHCRRVAKVIPILGFYLQPAVGGRPLPYGFWREFAEIDNVLGIKISPFNRYQTLEVLRAVAASSRAQDITLYTGNDDNIVSDLLTPYTFKLGKKTVALRIKGGLLGHWAVWTRCAVELLAKIHAVTEKNRPIPGWLVRLGPQVTDCNAAFFDSAHDFKGCVPGLHEVLHRQGLLKGIWCLDPHLTLSPGQAREIDRIYKAYPHLNDDAFVQKHLEEWLKD